MPLIPTDDAPRGKSHRRQVYASETIGLAVIVIVLLILTLVRYWHDIHWSLR